MSREQFFTDHEYNNAKSVLEGSSVFEGVPEAISEAIQKGKVESCTEGISIIQQDKRDKDVYLILEGEFDVLVNGRGMATREARDILGEMSVVDPTSKRSATVTSLEDSVVLHIKNEDFISLANKYPKIWRNIASEISRRLRQRGELVDEKGHTLRLFIGSSGEYLKVANAIQIGLMRTDIIVNIWSQDCFRPSAGTLASLEAEAEKCDLALLIFGNEDLTISKGNESNSPRDNVVFELGLFMGKLTSARVFFAKEIEIILKMPSDLYGITPIEYRRKSGEDISISVQPICTELIRLAAELGTK